MTAEDHRAWVEDLLDVVQTIDDEHERIDRLAAALHEHRYSSDEVAFVVKDSFAAGLTATEAERFAEQVRKRVLQLEWRNR